MKLHEKIKKGLAYCDSRDNMLNGCAVGCPYWYDKDGCHSTEMKIDALAYIQQLEERQPRWISVIDRIPAPETRVIASAVDNDGESIVVITTYTHRLYGLGLRGWIEPWQCFSCNYKITHWMPLPEPPKEE